MAILSTTHPDWVTYPSARTPVTAPARALLGNPATIVVLVAFLAAVGAVYAAAGAAIYAVIGRVSAAPSAPGEFSGIHDVSGTLTAIGLVTGLTLLLIGAVMTTTLSAIVRAAAQGYRLPLRRAWAIGVNALLVFCVYMVLLAIAVFCADLLLAFTLPVLAGIPYVGPFLAVAGLVPPAYAFLVMSAAAAGAGNPFAIGWIIGWGRAIGSGLLVLAAWLVAPVICGLAILQFSLGAFAWIGSTEAGLTVASAVPIVAVVTAIYCAGLLGMAGMSCAVNPDLAASTGRRGNAKAAAAARSALARASSGARSLEEQTPSSWLMTGDQVTGDVSGIEALELPDPEPLDSDTGTRWGVQKPGTVLPPGP